MRGLLLLLLVWSGLRFRGGNLRGRHFLFVVDSPSSPLKSFSFVLRLFFQKCPSPPPAHPLRAWPPSPLARRPACVVRYYE
jgi:hypothetical protein